MSKKLIIYVLSSILCMIVIFSFSSKNTNQSNGSSKRLAYNIVSIYEKVFNKDVDEKTIVNKLNYPIRKVAHYSIYFLLGILVYQIFLHTGIKHKELVALLICLIYAITDETHQLFVLGRSGRIFDVFIDGFGSLTAIFLIKFIRKRKNTKE